MNKVKQKQGRISRVKVNPEFKNLVRRLKRPPLTTNWHCITEFSFDVRGVDSLPREHSECWWLNGKWCWIVSDPAYKLWTKYNKQYKAWCKIK